MAVITGVDLIGGEGVVFVGLLAIGPFFAAAFASPTQTGWTALVALAAGLLLVHTQGTFQDPAHLTRLAGLGAGSLLAYFVASRREARERTLTRWQRIADGLQDALVRPVPARVGPLRCVARYVSAASEAKVGGDFHEVVQTKGCVRVIVGDVKGKGIEGVRLAAALLGRFREVALSESTLEGVAKRMSEAATMLAGEEDFATAVLLEVGHDTDDVVILNCGHPPPFRTSRSEDPVTLEDPDTLGLPLGIGDPGTGTRFAFQAGHRLMLYTDGVIEARDRAGRFFDLAEHARRTRGRPPERVVDEVMKAVQAHCGHVDDDIVLLLLERVERRVTET